MLQVIAALIDSLPRIFDWGLAPASVVLSLMALSRRTRPGAALGFSVIAALSIFLLLIAAASIAYVGWRFGHVVLDLLLNLGPQATYEFVVSLLRVAGVQPIDLVLMSATAVVSSVAAVALTWVRYRRQIPQSATAPQGA